MLTEYELNKLKKSFLFKNASENEIRQFAEVMTVVLLNLTETIAS